MGTRVRGMDEWLADLDSLEERAPKAFRAVVSKGAFNIKADWRKRWEAIRAPRTHIPHLGRGIGYDLTETPQVISADIGVDPKNRQAFLAEIIEHGTQTSAPHPGALPALEVESPRFSSAAEKVAYDLLAERP
jgi:hypothetical protein